MSAFDGVKHAISELEAAERKAEANDAAATVLAIECGELRQRVKELEKVLEPLAKVGREISDSFAEQHFDDEEPALVRAGDLRAAARAMP